MKNVVIVLPAYNAEKTLKSTIDKIADEKIDCKIVLVDDGSVDRTFEIAKEFDIVSIKHNKNVGYGGNQKTCYNKAIELKADIVVMYHPDLQYDAGMIKYFIKLLEEDKYDFILGTRIRSRSQALQSGMPFFKYISNRFLSIFQNILTGQNLSEWHSGYRGYTKSFLESVDYSKFSNQFLFDTQMIIAAIKNKSKIGELSSDFNYGKDSSSINILNSILYTLGSLFLCAKYFLFRR